MLFRQTLLYLPAQLVGPAAQLVAAIVWTHWLDRAPYGLLTFLIASQELMFLVCLSWWTYYTMRYLGGLDATQRAGFRRSEAPIFAASFVVQAIGTLLVFWVLGTTPTPTLAVSAIAYVGTRTLLVHLGERARAQGRIAIFTMGQLVGSIGGFVLALTAVATLVATPSSVLAGYAAAQFVGVVLMWRALGVTRGGKLPRRAILAAALGYGAPLLVAGGFTWIAQNGIRLVVERGAGADALGLIAVGWSLGQRLAATLAMLVISASFPLAVKSLHRGSRDDAYRQLALGGVMLMGLVIPASIGLCFLAAPFTTLFVAAPFRETTIAVLPYAAAAGALRNIRVHIADPVFLLIERPQINTAINIVDTATVLIACSVGLSMGGLVGATAGALVGTCLSTLAGFILADRLAGFVFPFADGLRIGAASAIMALSLAIVPWPTLALIPLVRMVAEVALGAATYAVAISAFYPSLRRDARRRLVAVLG